jgi:hypothetical protein
MTAKNHPKQYLDHSFEIDMLAHKAHVESDLHIHLKKAAATALRNLDASEILKVKNGGLLAMHIDRRKWPVEAEAAASLSVQVESYQHPDFIGFLEFPDYSKKPWAMKLASNPSELAKTMLITYLVHDLAEGVMFLRTGDLTPQNRQWLTARFPL